MPMLKGYSKDTISKNISREIKRGHPRKQAVAMSLESARRSKRKGKR